MAKAKQAQPWRNRIIGHGEESPEQLLANPANWRIHPKAQQDALEGAIRDVGFIRSVTVNKTTGCVVDGHLRVALAIRQNQPSIPVEYVELSEAEEAEALATLDPIAAMAAADKEKLAELLAEINTGEAGVQSMLAELAAKSGLDFGKEESVTDAGAQTDKADELREKWQTASGQLWQLGEHRLICGDCTDKATVARVMAGDKAEMVWTDPPYGVSVGDKNKFLNSIAPSNRVEENLENDTLDEPALFDMLSKAFDIAMAHCTAGAAWYVAAPPVPLHLLFGQVLKERGIWRQTLQWVKNNSTFSPMGVCYHWQAEPIFFGWLPNGGHRWYGGRQQTTVWNIDRPAKSPEHPTMKPVELVARAVENSSQAGEVAYEPFSGSGTTIIACEKLGRKCRAVEISPAYVAVALERYFVTTGKTPMLLEPLKDG